MLACLSRLHRISSFFDGAMVFLDTGSTAGVLMVAVAPLFQRLHDARTH